MPTTKHEDQVLAKLRTEGRSLASTEQEIREALQNCVLAHKLIPLALDLKQRFKTFQFTADPEHNKTVHPQKGSLGIYDFRINALSHWTDALKAIHPSPETVAQSVRDGAAGILTLDDQGLFISWQ